MSWWKTFKWKRNNYMRYMPWWKSTERTSNRLYQNNTSSQRRLRLRKPISGRFIHKQQKLDMSCLPTGWVLRWWHFMGRGATQIWMVASTYNHCQQYQPSTRLSKHRSKSKKIPTRLHFSKMFIPTLMSWQTKSKKIHVETNYRRR